MSPLSLLVTPLSIFLSLTTATGVAIHDTRVDKATLTALSLTSADTNYQASTKLVNHATDSHTHVERHTLSQSLRKLRADNPKISPRTNEEKKCQAEKNQGFGQDPSDAYAFPLS